MEFDQQASGARVPLPFKSVDTGMGLERMAAALQGVYRTFDIDLFQPIHASMRDLLGHDPETFEAERFSYQVIADHARAVTFLAADGVRPSNEGRGYVMRRILRRAVRHGRLLGRHEPFLADLGEIVIDTMSGAYPHLAERRAEIHAVLGAEERQFARTLDAGTIHFEDALVALTSADRVIGRRSDDLPADAPVLSGDVAFRLHDTYGFPIDLTVELAAEYGVRVDRDGFEKALAEQRERSRGGRKTELAQHAQATALYGELARRAGETQFLGYETTSADGQVLAILRDGVEYDELAAVPEIELREPAQASAELILDKTPFYAEGGGQVGDHGVIRNAAGEIVFTVTDTQRPVPGLIVHRGELHSRLTRGEAVHAAVDAERRARTMRNHTATHLLHRALRNTVGEQARQAGSLVTPDYLRFDYAGDRPLTADERAQIEAEVRRVVRDDRSVEPKFMSMAEAAAAGADAFFDEKYGERVRVMFVNGYSRELCGGTHCHRTGQIGEFAITGERSIGSGMRRIEAVTGDAADALLDDQRRALMQLVEQTGAQDVSGLPARVAELQARIKELERRAAGGSGRRRPSELARSAQALDGTRYVGYFAEFDSMKDLQSFAKDVRAELGSGVIALALDSDEPQLFVTVSEDLVARGISAANLVNAAVEEIGGRGGGRPEMAQGRGVRREGVPAALDRVADRLRQSHSA
jgi:alanyl-tRNA synthetase